MSETALMHEIMVALSARGNAVFRTNVGKVRMADGRFFDTGLPKGFSDLFVVTQNGRAGFIEVKFGKNKPSAEQLHFIERMRDRHALAGVAYSVDEALAIIEEAQA